MLRGDMAGATACDRIVMDMRVPGMDGLEAGMNDSIPKPALPGWPLPSRREASSG